MRPIVAIMDISEILPNGTSLPCRGGLYTYDGWIVAQNHWKVGHNDSVKCDRLLLVRWLIVGDIVISLQATSSDSHLKKIKCFLLLSSNAHRKVIEKKYVRGKFHEVTTLGWEQPRC